MAPIEHKKDLQLPLLYRLYPSYSASPLDQTYHAQL